MKNKIDMVAQKYMKSVSKIIDKDVDKTIRYVNNEMYDEAIKIYDSFIEQFYSYKTTSYVRHWERVPGTRQGQNLYFGKDIRKYTDKPKLIIYLPGDEEYVSNGGFQDEPMADDYRFDSAEEVLTYVFSGIRFPARFGRARMEWAGRYSSKLFHYEGTMQGAFDKFNTDFDVIAMKVAQKYLKTLGYY